MTLVGSRLNGVAVERCRKCWVLNTSGRMLLAMVGAGLLSADRAVGQLPNCAIRFDDSCPDDAPECGATFTGGEGCIVIGVPNCYSSGAFSYQIFQGDALTIVLADDLDGLSVFFAHQSAGGSGQMRFLDVSGGQVDAPLQSGGPCDSGSMPPTQVLFFSRAVRAIEVDNTGQGNLWLDTFEVNPPCTDSADCDDNEPCTIDTCDSGNCDHALMDCDDNEPCTIDTCDSGNCDHALMACDDGVACTDDACVAGVCAFEPINTRCPDDGTFCNGVESCDALFGCVSAGNPCPPGLVCNAQTEACDECREDADCSDADEATSDLCVGGSCVFTSISPTCPADFDGNGDVRVPDLLVLLGAWGQNPGHPADLDGDGVIGTADLIILLGKWGPCSAVPACLSDEDCDDGDVCTDDTCDTGSCQQVNNAATCDDGDACTDGDTCTDGLCGGTTIQCDDGDLCTDDSCNPVTGCVFDPINCTDGNACTDDSCDPATGCVNEAIDCDDSVACTSDSCNPASGCVHDPIDCDDGEPSDETDENGDSSDDFINSEICGAGSCGALGLISWLWMFLAIMALRSVSARWSMLGA